MKIRRNSLLYHLITRYTTYNDYEIDNICDFNKALIAALFNIFIFILAITMIISIYGSVIFYGILYLMYGYINEMFIISITVWIITLLPLLSIYLSKKLTNGYITETLKSIKQKYCIKIEFD